MRYVMARYQKEQRDVAYRIFVTDSLQLAPQNKYRTDRFADIIRPAPQETRSSAEIIEQIKSHLDGVNAQ